MDKTYFDIGKPFEISGRQIHPTQIRNLAFPKKSSGVNGNGGVVGIIISKEGQNNSLIVSYGICCAHSIPECKPGDELALGITYESGSYDCKVMTITKEQDIAVIEFMPNILSALNDRAIFIPMAFELENLSNHKVFFISGHEFEPKIGTLKTNGKLMPTLHTTDNVHMAKPGDSGAAVIHPNTGTLLGMVTSQKPGVAKFIALSQIISILQNYSSDGDTMSEYKAYIINCNTENAC